MNFSDPANLSVILVAALIFFALGSASGWLLGQLLKPPADNESGEKAGQEDRAGSVQLPSPPPTDPDKIELARLYRSRFSRDIFFEMDGKLLKSAGELTETQRAGLLAAAKTLSGLLGAHASTSTLAAPPRAADTSAYPPIAPASLPAIRPHSSMPDPATYMKKPSMNPVEALVRAAQVGQGKSNRPMSLAEQIDEVLQEMLEKSPLAGREISLGNNEALGLEVWVGGNRYDGIDAVPDSQVRDLIRAAVTEWQARSLRGSRG